MFYPFPIKDGDGNIFYATLDIRFVELYLPWRHALQIGPFVVDVAVADDEEDHYFTSCSSCSCSQGREEMRLSHMATNRNNT